MIFERLSPFLKLPALQSLTRDALLRMDPEIAHGATIIANVLHEGEAQGTHQIL